MHVGFPVYGWQKKQPKSVCIVRTYSYFDNIANFLCVSVDVCVMDHLVTVSQGALGNYERHFLNVAKEWLCHDCHIFVIMVSAQQTLYLLSSIFVCVQVIAYSLFLGGTDFNGTSV